MRKKEIKINSDELNNFKKILNNFGNAINIIENNYNVLSDSKFIIIKKTF